MGRLVSPKKRHSQPSPDLQAAMGAKPHHLRDIAMSAGEVRIQVPLGRPYVDMIRLSSAEVSTMPQDLPIKARMIPVGLILVVPVESEFGLVVVCGGQPDDVSFDKIKLLTMQVGVDVAEHKLIATPPGTWRRYDRDELIQTYTAKDVWALKSVTSRGTSPTP